jgi:RNA polymerase sigma factor (sigma-70 family)
MTDSTTSPGFDHRFEALTAIAYRVGYRLLGDREEAREVAQEAMARAFARWRRIAGYDEAWVARVSTNLAIDRYRRRRPTIPLDELAVGLSADHATTALERHGLVHSLRKLPRRQREVVVLRYLADLPERDVASLLGTTVGSVKQHAHRALSRLRSDLAPAFAAQEIDDVPAS